MLDNDLLQVRLHPSEWLHLPHGSRCHDCPHLAGRHIFILDMDDLGDDDVASTWQCYRRALTSLQLVGPWAWSRWWSISSPGTGRATLASGLSTRWLESIPAIIQSTFTCLQVILSFVILRPDKQLCDLPESNGLWARWAFEPLDQANLHILNSGPGEPSNIELLTSLDKKQCVGSSFDLEGSTTQSSVFMEIFRTVSCELLLIFEPSCIDKITNI